MQGQQWRRWSRGGGDGGAGSGTVAPAVRGRRQGGGRGGYGFRVFFFVGGF